MNKKRAVIFFAAFFALGARIFAQSEAAAPQAAARSPASYWRFGGFLYSTLGYDIDQQFWGGTDVMIDGASMSFLYYTRVNGDYDRDNWGVALSVMAISGYDNSASMRAPLPSLYQAYGWMKFFDKKLEAKMGYVRDTTYNSGGRISTDGGEGAGMMLKYTPITGLSVGGGFYAPRIPSASELSRDPSLPTNGTGPVEKATVSWGVAYEMSKVFKISYAGGWRDNMMPTMTSGIHLLAVPNLTANFEIFTSNIRYKEPEAGFPYIAFDETLVYRVGRQLTFGISAYQFLNNANILISKGGGGVFYSASYDRVDTVSGFDLHSVNKYDLGLSFDPYVSYQIGIFTPRLNLTVEHYGNKMETTMVATGTKTIDNETKRFLFSLKPQLTIRVGLAGIDLSYAMSMITDTLNGNKVDPVFDNKLTAMFTAMF